MYPPGNEYISSILPHGYVTWCLLCCSKDVMKMHSVESLKAFYMIQHLSLIDTEVQLQKENDLLVDNFTVS